MGRRISQEASILGLSAPVQQQHFVFSAPFIQQTSSAVVCTVFLRAVDLSLQTLQRLTLAVQLRHQNGWILNKTRVITIVIVHNQQMAHA